MKRWLGAWAVAGAVVLGTGCQHGDCYVSEEWWLQRVEPMRNAEGMPVVEVRASRWTELDCGAGRRVWIEVTADEIVIREPGPEEMLHGPAPMWLDARRYGYDEGIVVDLSWDGTGADVVIEDGGAAVRVECRSAPEGLPACVLP